MKNLFTLLFLFFVGISNAQFVTTGNANNSNVCNGYAMIQDSVTVISVQNWFGGGSVIQTGGYAVYNLCQGTYTVNYTTLNGPMTETFTIASNPCVGYVASVNTTYTSNPTACDGSATIVVTGGSAPYSYSWSNQNITSSQASNLCSGNYNVSVTDNIGCTSYVYFNITEDSTNLTNCFGLAAIITTTDASSNLVCDGTYTVTVTGGTAPYTYNSNNGINASTATDLCPGTYSVSIIDAAGCSTSATGFVNYSGANVGDTIVFNGTVFNDSTVIGSATSDWIDNCTFDYNAVVSAAVISYQSFGDSTIATWQIGLNNGTTILIDATYQFNSGFGVYNVILQLTCGQKDNPKFLQINSQLNFQSVGISEVGAKSVTIYPNPVINELNLKGLNGNSSFEIIDLLGRKVISGDVSTTYESINVETLKQGQYVLVLNNKNVRYTFKIVK
ncbi:MAG: T9SS C-terminal target domain-containing protein [Flavobacteriales bacterium]|nr:T9SS C-terminal target domain-containing protein [Crocinitomicaceae bacterium]NBX80165.1 T9SS C-terminal target domain-containing protein [Flavobacteriales bacterium]